MTLNEYCYECHKIAREHGWWDKHRNPLEVMALIMTELAEYIEAVRVGDHKGAKEELADIFIRLADYCGAMNINLGKEVEDKMEKNRVRPYRHGGKLW